MIKKTKIETSLFTNIAALNIHQGRADFLRDCYAKDACERFLQAAGTLSTDELLGMQISRMGEQQISTCVFSSRETSATTDDYNWIFGDYCQVEKGINPELKDLYEDGRKVYVLLKDKEIPWDINLERSYDRAKVSFLDMFTHLINEDAILQIVAAPDDNYEGGCGMVYISTKGEMSLKVRTMISRAFPFLKAEKISETEAEQEIKPLDYIFMVCIMSRFLLSAIEIRNTEDEKDNDKLPHTSIDDLKFSVRTYNCLKRAGIEYIDELLEMSGKDYERVRNLGIKGVREIKEKLRQYLEKSHEGEWDEEAPCEQDDEALHEQDDEATQEQDDEDELEEYIDYLDYLKSTKTTEASRENDRETYMEKLDKLVGLDNVKEQVKKIAAFARMQKEMKAAGKESLPITLNMEFVGNPGTAKTTVARIIAGVFYEIGLVSEAEIVEVGRADLVAKYVGHTAIKVKKLFNGAKGKVIFIDEAYSLAEDSKASFGDEAINTIVQEMENNREDTIVIFAGYPDKMEEFFAKNPGLRSRVPFTLTFEDYQAEDMLKITEIEAEKRGFTIAEAAKQKVLEKCALASENVEAGNGRFCRNLVESAVLNYASRVCNSDFKISALDFELIEEDFDMPNVDKKEEIRIGFVA